MDRRTFINALGATPLIGVSTADQRNTNYESETPGLIMKLHRVEDAFESMTVPIEFTLCNPTDTEIAEVIQIKRYGDTLIHEDLYTVDPFSIETYETTFTLRHDAAGHSVGLTLTGSEHSDEIMITAKPRIVPKLDSINPHPEKDNYIQLTYRVHNTGSAPGSTDVTIKRNDVPVESHTEYLSIDGEQYYTTDMKIHSDTVITLETDASMIREIVTKGENPPDIVDIDYVRDVISAWRDNN